MKAIVRIVLAGLAVTVFGAAVGMVTCGRLFNWVYTVEPVNVWKSMEGGAPPVWFLLGEFAMAILLAAMYAMVCKGVPGGNRLVRGLLFGLLVWIVGMLPGMFATYTFMTVAPVVVLYWTIHALFVLPIKGLIIAAIYGK